MHFRCSNFTNIFVPLKSWLISTRSKIPTVYNGKINKYKNKHNYIYSNFTVTCFERKGSLSGCKLIKQLKCYAIVLLNWVPNFYHYVYFSFLPVFVLFGKLLMLDSTLRHLLTYSMVQSPSWEAKWFAASQGIPLLSRNSKVHYGTHKRPSHVSILGQPNPVHIPKSPHF
jgi:hypothetical protein